MRALGKPRAGRDKGAMHSLPVFLRLRGRSVILLGEGDTAEAKRRLLERAGAEVVGEDGAAAIAIVAIADATEASAAVDRLRARGVLVNAVDRPDLCDFTLPAIVDRDPVLVAIGTGGASAGLAKALRQRIEAWLPSRLGALAEALHVARPAIRARFPNAAERRRAIDAALDGPLDPLLPLDDNAVDSWLQAPSVQAHSITTIALRSPDPDDLTIAEARALAQADTVVRIGNVPKTVLHRARADAVQTDTLPDDPLPGNTVLLVASD
jgi:uroporphyrin-III C-methyltransferase / precorrin-2 dehydrogenase / sirohydrochlorin ferrochelatase